MSTTPQRESRVLFLVMAAVGSLIFCGSVAFGIELLLSGSLKVPWPEEPVQTLSGVKAVLFVVDFLVVGAGVAWSSMLEYRRLGRSHE